MTLHKTNQEFYVEWQLAASKYCADCGTMQSFEQYNLDKDCKCGGSKGFAEMSPEAAYELWRKFMASRGLGDIKT